MQKDSFLAKIFMKKVTPRRLKLYGVRFCTVLAYAEAANSFFENPKCLKLSGVSPVQPVSGVQVGYI